MKTKKDDWMEKLVKNYKLPDVDVVSKPNTILTETQRKIILGKK